MTSPPVHLYATFARRVRALVLDSVVLIFTLLVVVYLAAMVQFGQPGRIALFAGLVLILVLYEPVLVAFHGRTLGQRLCNLRVVAPTADGRLTLWRAFVRWILKVLTGLASFATMGATRRNQALHDLPFGTTVEIAEPAKAGPYDFIYERPPISGGQLPSRLRRVLVISFSLVLLYIVMAVAAVATISEGCLDSSGCTAGERWLFGVIGTAWLAASIAVCIFGWQGRLFGARRGLPRTPVGLLALMLSLIGCGDDARISVSADLAPPLSVDMLTVTLRDRDRLLTWHGSDFRPRPENATPSTGEQDVFTSGPDLELTYQLESGGEVLSSGSVTLPRRRDWIWGVTIWARTTDPQEGCFGCFGSAAFSLLQAFRAVDRDSVWLVWGGNSISDPVIY